MGGGGDGNGTFAIDERRGAGRPAIVLPLDTRGGGTAAGGGVVPEQPNGRYDGRARSLVLSCFVLFFFVFSFVCSFALTIRDGLYDTRPLTHPTHTLRCHPLSPVYIYIFLFVCLFLPPPHSLSPPPTSPPIDPKTLSLKNPTRKKQGD